MTLNDFLEAIAKQLIARWPVRHVFVNRIPADADGNFYVRVSETTQEQKLDRRRGRTTRCEVCYLQADRDILSFNTWLEVMLDDFETLSVFEKTEDGTDVFRSLRLTNIAANQDGDERFFSFRFDARLNFVITPDEIPSKYYLDQNNTIRSVAVDQEAPVFTKEQLVKSKTLGVPQDAVAAILKDGQTYTREEAVRLVTDFLERSV